MGYLIFVLMLQFITPQVTVQCHEARTTVELTECLSRELRTEEERLAELESQLLDQGSPREKMLRQRAQTAWSLYRDLQCEAEAEEFQGGSMAGVAGLQCRLRLTVVRRSDLATALAVQR